MSSSPPSTGVGSNRITGNGVPVEWTSVLPDSAGEGRGGLALAEKSLAELAREFGTPLYVYDEATMRSSARRVIAAFPGARVSFAAKACSTPGVLRVLQEEGMNLDVVSLGELTAAVRAGFSPSQIHLHGNAKSEAELTTSAEMGIHAVVVDSVEEIESLSAAARSQRTTARVMVRVALALEAETHPHLQTAGQWTKFGISPSSPQWEKAVRKLRSSSCLEFLGIHCHLGSQIADAGIYARCARELMALVEALKPAGLPTRELSVGGGWAVAYRPGDLALRPEEVASALRTVISADVPRLAVEPGRAVVARAGIAVYEVRAVKEWGGRRIVAVDGGMGDNPRPALYGAPYAPVACEGPFEACMGRADVVGRYCESGDVLARDVALPQLRKGDLLCVPVSGAYQLVMASAYNLVPMPAVIMVNSSEARLLTRRATVDDLLAREILDEG